MRRRDKVLKTMEEKMAVPNLLAIDLVNEWTRGEARERFMNRRMAAYMARERPAPKSLKPRDLLIIGRSSIGRCCGSRQMMHPR